MFECVCVGVREFSALSLLKNVNNSRIFRVILKSFLLSISGEIKLIKNEMQLNG